MYRFCFALLCTGGQFSNYNPPPGVYIRKGDLTGVFLRNRFGGLIFGEAYFQNFPVLKNNLRVKT